MVDSKSSVDTTLPPPDAADVAEFLLSWFPVAADGAGVIVWNFFSSTFSSVEKSESSEEDEEEEEEEEES
jgi:hypothetical protein